MNFKVKITTLLIFITAFQVQSTELSDRLSKIPQIKFSVKENSNYKEYYEAFIEQPIDHANPKGKTFNHRFFIGFNNFKSNNVIDTDGYGIEYASKSDFNNELSSLLNANLIKVEHRYFGKSTPDSLDWNYLTLKQAADDYHHIKLMLDTILKGNWVSTGISKGGQSALAYKIYYSKDVFATVVYGTPIKNSQSISVDSLLGKLSKTECGKKITAFQLFAFRNKDLLMTILNNDLSIKRNDFGALDKSTLFDYLILELPFSFWQGGNKCEEIPDSSCTPIQAVEYMIKLVPPRFFSKNNSAVLNPSFYMFYHELGYYEYETAPFKTWLKQESYLNTYFAPVKNIKFNDSYSSFLNNFLKNTEEKGIFFVYGENDPWTSMQSEKRENKFIVKNGSHKSRIKDLSETQQSKLLKLLTK